MSTAAFVPPCSIRNHVEQSLRERGQVVVAKLFDSNDTPMIEWITKCRGVHSFMVVVEDTDASKCVAGIMGRLPETIPNDFFPDTDCALFCPSGIFYPTDPLHARYLNSAQGPNFGGAALYVSLAPDFAGSCAVTRPSYPSWPGIPDLKIRRVCIYELGSAKAAEASRMEKQQLILNHNQMQQQLVDTHKVEMKVAVQKLNDGMRDLKAVHEAFIESLKAKHADEERRALVSREPLLLTSLSPRPAAPARSARLRRRLRRRWCRPPPR